MPLLNFVLYGYGQVILIFCTAAQDCLWKWQILRMTIWKKLFTLHSGNGIPHMSPLGKQNLLGWARNFSVIVTFFRWNDKMLFPFWQMDLNCQFHGLSLQNLNNLLEVIPLKYGTKIWWHSLMLWLLVIWFCQHPTPILVMSILGYVVHGVVNVEY